MWSLFKINKKKSMKSKIWPCFLKNYEVVKKTFKKTLMTLLTLGKCDTLFCRNHCVKSVCIMSYSGLYFPAFGLNTERQSLSLRIQSENEKMRTRIIANTDTFYSVNVQCINVSLARMFLVKSFHKIIGKVVFYIDSLSSF